MHATSVTPVLVDPQRLDPDYYHPQHLEDEQRLRGFGAVPLKETGKFFAGPFGSKLPSSLYLESGVPLFRVGNVGSMEVDLRDMAHLAPHVHAELSASEVHPGDLLIVKASVGEKICRVPATMDRANITQHIIAIRPNGKYDFDYLTAFLFGKYGRRQLERRSLGSIIQYLGIVDSKTVLFPKLDDKAQAYIGDKVRQAERLRARARTLQADMDRLITLDPLQLALSSPNQRTNRVRAVQLEPRLDAKFYSPRSMRVFAAALACDGVLLGDLKPEISNGFEHRTFVDKGRAYVTVTQVNSLRLDLSDVPHIPESIPIPDRARLTDKTVLAVRSGVTIGTVVTDPSISKGPIMLPQARQPLPGRHSTFPAGT